MYDYDRKHWAGKPCPKVNCKKKPCCCGLRFVSVPAPLAEEMTPKNGAFSNSIVRFEDTGEIWIYDMDGIPVQIKEGHGAQG